MNLQISKKSRPLFLENLKISVCPKFWEIKNKILMYDLQTSEVIIKHKTCIHDFRYRNNL